MGHQAWNPVPHPCASSWSRVLSRGQLFLVVLTSRSASSRSLRLARWEALDRIENAVSDRLSLRHQDADGQPDDAAAPSATSRPSRVCRSCALDMARAAWAAKGADSPVRVVEGADLT